MSQDKAKKMNFYKRIVQLCQISKQVLRLLEAFVPKKETENGKTYNTLHAKCCDKELVVHKHILKFLTL
jgi:hypothetical protein